MSKLSTRWYSERLGREILVVRWGEVGAPVLLFPTAGGDAEEIERFHMIDVLAPLLEAGRVKIYSCDSVAGRIMLQGGHSPEHQMWVLNQFQQFVYRELVPAIRSDCQWESIGVIAAGASIGAFNALAVLCRFPDAFTHAVCLSGTYDLDRFFESPPTEDLYFSSPLHFLPGLGGELLSKLRTRFVLLASGEGKAENIGESWRVANLLGEKGVPNRVDSWGPDWPHDWPTWRKMLPQYLDELTPAVAY
jgi:esterase/lipase superfamily enzyme